MESVKNQRGYVTVTILTLLPFVFAALAVMASTYLLMRSEGSTRHLCRMSLLEAQAQVSEKLNRLIQLNKRATILRKKRKAAEAAVIAAIAPPAKALARANLEIIKAQQLQHAALQKSLYLGAKAISSAAPAQAATELERHLLRLRAIHTDDKLKIKFHAQIERAKFELKTEPKDSLTPNYIPPTDFSTLQKMRVSWKFAIEPILPSFLRPFINGKNLELKAQCSSTLEKEGEIKWQPTLSADKS